jgi:hypothetical protein
MLSPSGQNTNANFAVEPARVSEGDLDVVVTVRCTF